ncbi:odorant receptor 46a [Tribolium castaneum]|uniref:Odorant receptor n=1 Tax=Tribolium castaneum TaxID=7070 RepID=D6WWX4_TRICA|nr:PREDICTED: odorant receptor 46a, isoform A-like [Tribolium castaneum]EFA09246.1 odorant receptor 15 [Tribolium castaneum]|eukprot:XP_015838097.1 PREDICTED: odorant receptor 46a, isoform A-like [Tribolium castaneum]
MLVKWSSVIKINIFLLKWVGLWPGEKYQLNVYSFYAFTVIILILCGQTLSTGLTLILGSGDVDTFTETLFVVNIEFMTAWKALNFALNRKKFIQLLNAIDKPMFQPRNDKQVTLVLRNIDGWRVMFKMFAISLALSLIFTGLLPIFTKTYKQRKFPYEAWYPFDSSKFPIYQLCYMYQMASASTLVVVILNVDTLVAAMNICIGLQCDLLCDNLRNLHFDTSKSMNQKLIECIKHHKSIISFAEKFRQAFNWSIFLQFFISSTSLAIVMFKISRTTNYGSEYYRFISFACSVLVQVFIYCWFGNEVIVKSEKIPYALFECDWTPEPLEVKRSMIIFIIRTQRILKITVSYMFDLSLPTFLSILKTGWSYFAFMNQVTEVNTSK